MMIYDRIGRNREALCLLCFAFETLNPNFLGRESKNPILFGLGSQILESLKLLDPFNPNLSLSYLDPLTLISSTHSWTLKP